MPVICPYCGDEAILVRSSEVYSCDYGPIWLCRPCAAWVGCHKGTDRPLGRLADAELRRLKRLAHLAFDPIWKRLGKERRSDAYAALAGVLHINRDHCHIGMFDSQECEAVILACEYGLVEDAMEAAPV